MRPIMFAATVLAAVACSDRGSSGPTSPTSAALAASHAAQSDGQMPFVGAVAGVEDVVVAPPNLYATGAARGTATQLGRFTMTDAAVVDLVTSTSTGTITLTAANGDELFATFTGIGVPLDAGRSRLTEVATITGGSGRFAAATGTFTLQRDIEQATGAWSGSFDGRLDVKD